MSHPVCGDPYNLNCVLTCINTCGIVTEEKAEEHDMGPDMTQALLMEVNLLRLVYSEH